MCTHIYIHTSYLFFAWASLRPTGELRARVGVRRPTMRMIIENSNNYIQYYLRYIYETFITNYLIYYHRYNYEASILVGF